MEKLPTVEYNVYALTSIMTPIEDMAVLMGIPEVELRQRLEDPNAQEYHDYRKAKAEIGLMLRINNIELAKAGSPTAAEAVEEYYKSMRSDL